jgi:Arc/MetJ family transcription regulator
MAGTRPAAVPGILMPPLMGTMMLVIMRTTLTLDDDVALLLAETAHRTRTPVKQIVNTALRAALSPPAAQREPFREHVHHAELAPGLDLTGFNKLADELEDEAIVRLAQQ